MVAVWLLAVALQSAAASDGLTFHSQGRDLPLVKSTTEFAVAMDAPAATTTRAKIAADPRCSVEPIPWAASHVDHCIVRVARANAATKQLIRSMPGVQEVQAVYRFADSEEPMLSSGNAVVRLRAGLSAHQRDQFFSDFRVRVVRVIDETNSVYIVRPRGGGASDEVQTAMAMARDDRVRLAHPDFVVATMTKQILSQVEDEFFDQQWHLNNTGQGLGTPGADINVARAWESTFGEEVRMGILDDSVDVTHEDLAPNYTQLGQDPRTGMESPTAPIPSNIGDYHGTAVLGLALADANNVGVRGVAPAARFAASRGINDLLTFAQLASAYTFARQRDVDVHINSWGFTMLSNLQVGIVVDAIETAFLTGRQSRGMVVVFAAGNDGVELGPDDDLATLPTVIGVGATNADDQISSFSNFGADIDIMAPSGNGNTFLPGMVTTDNTDTAGFASFGFNDGSGADIFGVPDFSNPNYTRNFSGTSAACPVAAGVAALVISRNLELTAEQVRTIMFQTAEKVDPANAAYDPITERSLQYGYGRLDAGAAVDAANASVTNGGFTWPEPIKTVSIRGTRINWTVGDNIRLIDPDNNEDTPPIPLGERTVRTLVVESATPFTAAHTFIPQDGVSYNQQDEPVAGIVVKQNNSATSFALPGGPSKLFYALFPSNSIGRFGFGVSIDTDGNVDGIAGAGGGGSGVNVDIEKPQVSIDVSPLSGTSPLQVRFKGNALSLNPVDAVVWDFDDGETADRPQLAHRYVVPPGETRRFFATFSVTDTLGNMATRSVGVDVQGSDVTSEQTVDAIIRIIIGLPGSVGSDVDRGVSPFSVEYNIDGDPANDDVVSVQWDLGDGATASTRSVPHTYINDSTVPQTLPVTVELVTRSANGTLVTQTATRFVTVDPDPNNLFEPSPPANAGSAGSAGGGDATPGIGDNASTTGNANTNENANSNGAGTITPPATIPCGAGMSLAFVGLFALALVRRRLVR